MAENVRPPVAIRTVRPYATEDEFLENELETVGKTSVILIGAHPRPTGVILRFEMTLATGATLLRGEGRVLSHKDNAFRGQPGLSLRFTRLDPRSKALVDRAAAIRESRLQAASAPAGGAAAPEPEPPPPPPPPPPATSDPALANALTADTPPPPRARRSQPAARASSPPPLPTRRPSRAKGLTPPPAPVTVTLDDAPTFVETRSEPPPPLVTSIPREPVAATAPAPAPTFDGDRQGGAARAVERPADREELLARLRERAAHMPPDRIDAILAAKRGGA